MSKLIVTKSKPFRQHQIHENLRKVSTAFHLKGAGRHLLNDDIDAELATWVEIERKRGFRISRRMIQFRALELFEKKAANSSNTAENFRASTGWLEKFLNRHNFRLRRPGTVCQNSTAEYEKTIVNLLIFVRSKEKKELLERYGISRQFDR